MRIYYTFYSLKNLSDLSNGERLLQIMSEYGLNIEKAGPYEPIRKAFSVSNLQDMWKSDGLEGDPKSCYFLFKGQKFSGMVTWHINLFPGTRTFNSIHLELNIQKNYSTDRLIQLGDDIFAWSEAVYGYITEASREMAVNIHLGIGGLMWVNYFGPAYMKESDFHLPNNQVPVGHGVRVNLSETPNDERLSDLDFLQSLKDEIGYLWFAQIPSRINKKVPLFDKSAITRQ